MTEAPDDPRWPTAAEWLARPPASSARRLTAVGAPVRLGSISGGRFDLAPEAIRRALAGYSTWDGEVDVREVAAGDAGDLDVVGATPADALAPIEAAVRDALSDGETVAVLGGDNSVTRPAVRGVAPDLSRVGLLTLDAHHDLRDTDGELTNGNPVRALLEDGLPGENVAQVGIQPFANSQAHATDAEAAGIAVVSVDEVHRAGIEAVVTEALAGLGGAVDAIHVDIDLDVLDRAFAPACPGSRPGGLAPGELLAAVRLAGAHPLVRSVDLVEVDPERDVAGITVGTAAACLLAFAAGLAARRVG
jgi:formiminoglutamase